MKLQAVDLVIMLGYLLTVILIGLWVSACGAKDLDSYSLGGKAVLRYLLGISDAHEGRVETSVSKVIGKG